MQEQKQPETAANGRIAAKGTSRASSVTARKKSLAFSPSALRGPQEVSFYNLTNGQDEGDDRNFVSSQKPLSKFEKTLFALVSGMVTKNELPFNVLLVINFLEDFQLTQFSWRPSLFMSDYEFMPYIFNPIYYLVEKLTWPFLLFVLLCCFALLSSMVYCTFGLVKNSLKVMWPLQLLRILTVLMSTVFFMPIIEVFMHAVVCHEKPDPLLHLVCNGSLHNGIRVIVAFGAVFIIPYGLLMSVLYFDPNPASKSGKSSGQFDMLYMAIRVVIVVVDVIAPDNASFAINFVLLGLLLLLFSIKQPFYSEKLNNLRFGVIFSAWMVSACALFKNANKEVDSELGYVIAALVIGFSSIPAGFFLNKTLVWAVLNKIYDKLAQERLVTATKQIKDLEIHQRDKLMLEQIKVEEVVNANAVIKKVSVFLFAGWVEIASRFVSHAYKNEQSLLLSMEIFDTGFKQYPRTPFLYLIYLQYINVFMPGMQPFRLHLVQTLQRRCNLLIAHKFQLYQLQQLIKQQERSRGIKGSNATSLNFVSYVEYQSMENTVRKSHIKALTEVRDFWAGIRNGKPAEEVVRQLARISSLVAVTKRQYLALTDRFPNSSGVLTLYARFTALVLADKDTAKQINENAEDFSGEIDTEPATNELRDAKLDATDHKSQGSSHTSGSQKEQLLLKKQRETILDRMHAPIGKYRRTLALLFLVLLGCLAGTTYLGYEQLEGLRAGVSKFSASLSSRNLSIRLMFGIRRMAICKRNNDETCFKAEHEAFRANAKSWTLDVVPAYSYGPATTELVRLALWTEGEFNIERIPGNEAAQMMSTYAQMVAVHAPTLFSNLSTVYWDTAVRFILDNGDDLLQYYIQIRQREIQAFVASIKGTEMATIGLVGATCGLAVLFAIVIPSYIREIKLVDLLTKLPKKQVLQHITLAEEEVELLGDNEDYKDEKIELNKDNRGSSFILSFKYLFSVLLFIIAFAVTASLIASTVDSSIDVPEIYDTTNFRKTYFVRIQKCVLDAIEDDRNSFTFGEVQGVLRNAVIDVEETNTRLATLFASHIPPAVPESDPVFVLLRKGGCFMETQQMCDDPANYDPEVGYTKKLASSGLDSQVDAFMSAARRLIDENLYSVNSTQYRLMERLNDAFIYAFTGLLKEYNEAAGSKVGNTLMGMYLLMAAGLLAFCAFTYQGLYVSCNQFMRNNEQIMNFIYTVPVAERSKINELNTFVESGGTSIE